MKKFSKKPKIEKCKKEILKGKKVYLQLDGKYPIIPIDMEIINLELNGELRMFDMDSIDLLYHNSDKITFYNDFILFNI